MAIVVKKPTMHISLEFTANSAVYSPVVAVERLLKVMNTLYEHHPELKVKAVRVS